MALRFGFLVIAAVALSGCSGVGLPFGGATGASALIGSWSKVPRQVIVSSKSLRIEGPEGYCPDIGSIQDGEGNSFVALASCSRFRAGETDPQVPALLTISVQGPASDNAVTGAENKFISFLQSEAGLMSLARSGNPADVSVDEIIKDGRAVYALVTDASDGQLSGTESKTWRGFFDLNGRFLSISALSLTADPYSKDAGLNLLQSFELKLRAENPQKSINPDV